jgi:hypothetical protein
VVPCRRAGYPRSEARIAPFDAVPLNIAEWWPPPAPDSETVALRHADLPALLAKLCDPGVELIIVGGVDSQHRALGSISDVR